MPKLAAKVIRKIQSIIEQLLKFQFADLFGIIVNGI